MAAGRPRRGGGNGRQEGGRGGASAAAGNWSPREDLKEKQINLQKLRLFLPVMEGKVPVAVPEKRPAEEGAADLPTKPAKVPESGSATGSQTTKKASALSLDLGPSKETVATPAPNAVSVAAAFSEDRESEAETRMKNTGKHTPPSAGAIAFQEAEHRSYGSEM